MIENTNPSICIIDDSSVTTKIYGYLFNQFLVNPNISLFNHPWDINIHKLKKCDLIIIDEIMNDITGTQFIHDTINEYFKNDYHNFPNVIFISALDIGDIAERVKSLGIDKKIPAYRICQKPIIPEQLKSIVVSICPNLKKCLITNAVVPNSSLPWKSAMSRAIHEIFGIDYKDEPGKCTLSI